MKLLRYGPKGQEKPAMLDADGGIRSLAETIGDIDGAILANGLNALRSLDPTTLPLVERGVRIAEPVANVGKFLCIG